jgi:hypothetical protein
MSDQKDIDIKEKIKVELNGEIKRKNKLNFSSEESEKCDHYYEQNIDSFPSSPLNSRMTHDGQKQERTFNFQKFDQNNQEMKFWFLDTLASFLLVNARTVDSLSTDNNNSINNSSMKKMDIRRCRELDVNNIKLDDNKCEITRAFILEMEIVAIITPSYRNRPSENDKNRETVFRKMSNESVNSNYTNNDNNDDNNDNDNDNNNNDETQNEDLITGLIKSVQSLTVIFKALLPESDTQYPVSQNMSNSHTNKQNKYSIENDLTKPRQYKSKRNLSFKYNKFTDMNTKCTEKKTIICTDKEQEKLYYILCVCFCAILDSFILFFQTTISKKSISEIVEIIYSLYITNPDIKSTLVNISNLFHNYNNKIQNLSRNLWSRICCAHRFSASIPELIYRITSNPHFPLLDSITTSTPNNIISNKNDIKNEHKTENKTVNQNQNGNGNNNGRIRIEKEDELSFISSIENIRTCRKRKHYPFPSVLPDNSTPFTLPLPTSLLHSNTPSSQEVSFLSSLPQIRIISQNGVLDVDEKRSHGNTEFKKTEFVETENDLTNPLLWEEFSDLIEEKNASGGEVGKGKGNEEGKRKENEEEIEGRADMRGKEGKEERKGVKGMRIESGRAERNTSKNENFDPSGKRMKTEKKENSERGKMKKNITSKSLKGKIKLSGEKKEGGVAETAQLGQSGYDNSAHNNDNNNNNNVNDNNVNVFNNDNNNRSDNTDGGRSSNSNSNIKNTNNNHSFRSQHTPTDTTENADTHTNSMHKTTKPLTDLGSDSKQFIAHKKIIKPFHNLPISNAITNTNTNTNTKIDEYDGIKKETFREQITTIRSAPPPLILIPENLPKNVPENVPESVHQNTEAGWNKKDISKKWSTSF